MGEIGKLSSSDNLAISQMQTEDWKNVQTAVSKMFSAKTANSYGAQLGGLLGTPASGISSIGGMGSLIGMMNPLMGLTRFFGSGSGSGVMPMQLGGMYSLPPVGINIGLGLSLAGTGLGGVTPLLGSLFGGVSGTSSTREAPDWKSHLEKGGALKIEFFKNKKDDGWTGNCMTDYMGGLKAGETYTVKYDSRTKNFETAGYSEADGRKMSVIHDGCDIQGIQGNKISMWRRTMEIVSAPNGKLYVKDPELGIVGVATLKK